MKYGKGTDLPGMPHSQGAHIGVIYVSPNDDRQTVLTAILAEDRLKREQIVLDLPQKNKAFQRPEDFDDLKTLRRKIQAKLIFVTPAGPGPADFARQRRFDVFSNMDSFVRSLTSTSQSGRATPATSQPNKSGKKGFLGIGAKKAAPVATAAASGIVADEAARKFGTARNTPSQRRQPGSRPANDITPANNIANLPTGPSAQRPPTPLRPTPLPPQTPLPQIDDEDPDTKGFLPPSFADANIVDADITEPPDEENKTGHAARSADAATFGAGAIAADTVSHTPSTVRGSSTSPNTDSDDDWDALPPAPGQSIPSNVPTTPAATVTDTTNRPTPGRPLRTPATPDPSPIVLGAAPPTPQSTGKTTKVLSRPAPAGVATPLPKPVTPPPTTPNRNTGKTVAAGVAGAMAGAAAGEALSDATKTPTAPTRPNKNTGKTPVAPTRTTTNKTKTPSAPPRTPDASNTLAPAGSISAISQGWPPPGAGSSRRTPPANRNRRRILLVALVILVLLVVVGLIASSARFNNLGFMSSAPPATITITPANKPVQDTYVLPSVDGDSNIANREVGTHQLTSTKPATDTATATGQGKTIARNATGTLTFKNAGSSFDLGANTSFPGPNGVTVANDQFVTIPAGNVAAGTFGVITVNAHAVPLGTAGNTNGVISNQACCRADSTIIIATSSTFTGGVDSKTYTFLQESDVAKAAANVHPDATALRSDAQSDINGHIQQPGQKLVNPINCDDPKTATDAPIGDQGIAKAVTSAKVTVSVTCNAQVYDANAVQTIAQNALKQKVSKDPTLAGYVLIGNIITQVQPIDGPITFSVTAKGVWSYQWTDANKQKLLAKIKGKTKAQAQAILNKDPGIDQETKAKIEIDNGGTTLPNDAKQITIVVNTVKGL